MTPGARARSTSTSSFGVSKRENHNSDAFYRRFTAPEVSDDSEVCPEKALDKLIVGDARDMSEVPDSSVALVVTSPPYFAGKEYEEALGENGVPATYLEYLDLLRDVFSECVRTLEPGGRMAVNVANLGRKPYRSLSADVIGILQNDLRLLLRGEIVWLKQRTSSGSCAWGSFQRPSNPVLRDVTERVVIASKGRFDRALPPRKRYRAGLPSNSTMTREDFMENTLDIWEIPPEIATRVGHPAPFPVELPSRLIGLFTYKDDLVLDPFCGSGSTAVAAVRCGRHYVGYDLDDTYVELAEARVRDERERITTHDLENSKTSFNVTIPAVPDPALDEEDLQARAVREGRAAKDIARAVIELAGFTRIRENQRQSGGVEVDFVAVDERGDPWFFDVSGSFTSHRSGLRRTDTLWKALGKAAVLHQSGSTTPTPLVLLTTNRPTPGSQGAEALAAVCGRKKPVHAVVELLHPSASQHLRDACRKR
jgi:site-specific DNA-methyltransferase (adenine-specific)